jgi:AcrR family transcriptional regulator
VASGSGQKSPDPASARRRLSAERRRESILDVARHAFSARGYDGVRTQELAAAAGISEALIYQHFASKRDLYREVVRRSAEALAERLGDATRGVVPEERLERGLEAFVAFVADRSSGWALLLSRVSDPDILAYQREAYQACMRTLTELFAAEAGKKSARRGRQLEQLAEAIAGGAEALANWWSDNPNADRAEGMSLIVDFARRGLESIGSPGAETERPGKRFGDPS